MKFTIHINQKQALALGISNINQAIILDYLVHQTNWAETIIVNKKAYKWVARQAICKQLPIIDIQEKTAYRHLKSLHELGFIEYIKDGKKDLVRVLKKAQSYYVDSEIPKEPKKDSKILKTGFENPKNGNLKSTYKSYKDKTINDTDYSNRELDIEKRFKITADWKPSSKIADLARLVFPNYKKYDTEQNLNDFLAYWMGQPKEFNEHDWHRRYLKHLKHLQVNGIEPEEPKEETEFESMVRICKDKGLEPYRGYPHENPKQFITRIKESL